MLIEGPIRLSYRALTPKARAQRARVASVRSKVAWSLRTSATSHGALALTTHGINSEMMFHKLGLLATFVALIVVTAFVLACARWPQLDD
jgi:hypothetical protein